MFVAVAAARVGTQSPPPPRDSLASELAGRIASIIAPQVRVSLEQGDANVDAEVAGQLAARGVQIVGTAADVPSVRVSCFDNLRERACAAEVGGPTRRTILVTRRHERTTTPPADRFDLALRAIVSHEAPILDVARDRDDLLALTRGEILRYRQRDGGWTQVGARAISSSEPWPRDLRGRVRLADSRVDVFLPGMTCAGSVDSLAISCAAQNSAWPLEIEGARLEPARNHFTVSGGPAFYGVARLGAGAGARWLAATLDRRLTFVDENLQTVPTTIVADDVVSLAIPCAPSQYVLASTPDRDDALTLFRVVRRQLSPAATVVLPGELTALWLSRSADTATVITRDRAAGRYVAHELTASCSR